MRSFVDFVHRVRVVPNASSEQQNQLLAVGASVSLPIVRNLMGRAADCSDALSKLTCPILVVHGTEDAMLTPSISQRTTKHMSPSCPNCQLAMVEGRGHVPFVEQQERFATYIQDFVAKTGNLLTKPSYP